MAAVSLSDFFAGSVFLAGGRREFVGLVERRGGRVVVVRAVVGFDFSASGLVDSVVSEAFSAGFSGDGDGFVSAVSVISGGGLGSVAPTDDRRLPLLFVVEVSVGSVFSATGMPPLNGSNVPPK